MIAFQASIIALVMSSALATPVNGFYNGGYNVKNVNDNDLVDAKNLKVGVDVLKREATDFSLDLIRRGHSSYNAGHNVFNYNDDDLIDAKDILAAIDILKRANFNYAPESWKRGIEGADRLFLRGTDDDDCVCKSKPPPSNDGSCDNEPSTSAQPPHSFAPTPSTTSSKKHHHHQTTAKSSKFTTKTKTHVATPTSKTHSKTHTHTKTHSDKTTSTKTTSTSTPTCSSGYTYYNGGSNVVNENDNDLVDLKNLTLDIDILGLGGKKEKSTTSHDSGYKCQSKHGCCVKPGKGCASGFTYINEGHNIYNSNDNDLIDLKDLTIDLNILSTGQSKTVKDPSTKCQSKGGCCAKVTGGTASCKNGYTYINKGHNIVNKNDNDLIDLKNLTIDINILSSTPKKETKKASDAGTCDADAGCCVKVIDGGHNVVNSNDNDLIDAKGASINLSLLSGGDGHGLLSGLLGGLGL